MFMGTIFYMSLFGMNRTRRYWGKNSRIDQFQPVLDNFNSVCQAIEKEELCSVDENTIPYKGKKSKLRQYNPKKPKKWGCKLYMMCTGTLGIIVNTSLYGGKSNQPAPVSGLLRSSQVVMDIAAVLPENQN